MLSPSSKVAIFPLGYLTLATITFSANCFEILEATSKAEVSKLKPSLTAPSGSVIVIFSFGSAAYLAFYASNNVVKYSRRLVKKSGFFLKDHSPPIICAPSSATPFAVASFVRLPSVR